LVAQLDVNGNFLTAANVGDFGRDQGQTISIDNNGGVYTAGEFTGQSVDFNPNIGVEILNSLNGRIFLLKLSSPVINNNAIAITDTNFEQYLIDANIDSDTVINGQILKSDIENVIELLINDKNISDLTGIEGFINLKELFATNNQINSIDLSNNLLLEKLFIANNQLSTIDVSKNINLKNIDVGENQLTEIDVHLLLELESLSIYKNQLTEINLFSNRKLIAFLANENKLKSLDFRINKDLNWIDLEDNSLEHLNLKNGTNTLILDSFFDVTNNPNLTCIEVDDVAFSETNWTQKDTSANFSLDCAPANDFCTDAIPLIIGQEIPGDINSGNISSFTDCVDGNVIADVWYKIAVPTTGELSLQGNSDNGTVKFALYDSCSSNSTAVCGETISLSNQTVGEEYYVRVWIESNTSSKTTNVNNAFGEFTLITTNSSEVLSTNNISYQNDKLLVHPNPASNFIKISSNKIINSIEIFSALGKQVLKKTSKELNNKSIDVSNLSPGIYLLKINNKQFKKIIIN
jgi:hypothetical protein